MEENYTDVNILDFINSEVSDLLFSENRDDSYFHNIQYDNNSYRMTIVTKVRFGVRTTADKLLADDQLDILVKELKSFIRAYSIIEHARHCYADEEYFSELIKRSLQLGNKDKKLTLKEVAKCATEAQEIIKDYQDSIFKWLDRNVFFHTAYNKINNKKWTLYARELIDGKVRFHIENEDKIKFMEIVILTIFDVIETSRYRKVKLSERINKLSTKLYQELDSIGLLDKRIKSTLREFTGNYRMYFESTIKKTEQDKIKEIVTILGKRIKKGMCLVNTQKGRPYPDVVAELVAMFGYEVSERQANRYLTRFDTKLTVERDL